jgi:hypothetical protein
MRDPGPTNDTLPAKQLLDQAIGELTQETWEATARAVLAAHRIIAVVRVLEGQTAEGTTAAGLTDLWRRLNKVLVTFIESEAGEVPAAILDDATRKASAFIHEAMRIRIEKAVDRIKTYQGTNPSHSQ